MRPLVRPTGTPIARALAQVPQTPTLPLTEEVPLPPLRYGAVKKCEVIAETLRQMAGDKSFVIKDANTVYAVAKKLGFTITTRKEGDQVRVWRLK